MRAKQSSTGIGMYSTSESSTPPAIQVTGSLSSWPVRIMQHSPTPPLAAREATPRVLPMPAEPTAQMQGEALLHDARNLIGTLGLYCDLLSMPGVLKPQHRQYADDLRLVSTRSEALIERLVARAIGCPEPKPTEETADAAPSTGLRSQPSSSSCELEPQPRPVSLRRIVERCTSLLGRVAGGCEIEVRYGEAATVPVVVAEEAVERILVNLVRNACAALAVRASAIGPETAPASIRIGVGVLANRVGDPKPWPFRRVRLTVEDAGCGMTPEQLERLLSSGRAPARGGHGIGFRVVRELVAGSDGDLRVMSEPGSGTCVQIEWPMHAASLAGQGAGGWTC